MPKKCRTTLVLSIAVVSLLYTSQAFLTQRRFISTVKNTAWTIDSYLKSTENSNNRDKINNFIVEVDSEVSEDEISNQNLIHIVNLEATDLECNQLCWKCLGYTFDKESQEYDNKNVFPKWREKYPQPPDVIGMKRIYDPSVDKPVRDASMALMRSIPRDFKGGVRELESDGFRGFKLKDLTPNKTRRAQLVNWLIFYRQKLHGKSIEELQAARAAEEPKEEEEANLPSERNYQKLRVD